MFVADLIGDRMYSVHICPYCKREYQCNPAQDQPKKSPCLADDCISYDPERDLDIKMGYKEPVRKDH